MIAADVVQPSTGPVTTLSVNRCAGGSGMRAELEREYVEYVTVRLPRLHRIAYLLCSDAHQADDIVQAALTSLYLNWKRASGADNLDAYVHRIVVRRYLDERRRRWSGVLLGDAVPEQVVSGEHGIEERDALQA